MISLPRLTCSLREAFFIHNAHTAFWTQWHFLLLRYKRWWSWLVLKLFLNILKFWNTKWNPKTLSWVHLLLCNDKAWWFKTTILSHCPVGCRDWARQFSLWCCLGPFLWLHLAGSSAESSARAGTSKIASPQLGCLPFLGTGGSSPSSRGDRLSMWWLKAPRAKQSC